MSVCRWARDITVIMGITHFRTEHTWLARGAFGGKMKELEIKCPECGGSVSVDPVSGKLRCDQCGESFSIGSPSDQPDQEQASPVIDGEQLGYDFERGRQRASVEFAQGFADTFQVTIAEEAPKKSHAPVFSVMAGVVIISILAVILFASPFGMNNASGSGRNNSSSNESGMAPSSESSTGASDSGISDDRNGSSASIGANDDAEHSEIEVVGSAYTIDPRGSIECVVVLYNPNEDYAAKEASISFTGRGADGAIIFNYSIWRANNLTPGSTTYWSESLGVQDAASVVSVDFALSVKDRDWVLSDADVGEFYSFSNISAYPDRNLGYLSVTGEITLEDGAVSLDDFYDVRRPKVVCVLRDENGNVVGGFSNYFIGELSEGSPTPFQIVSFCPVPEYSSLELYAYPS